MLLSILIPTIKRHRKKFSELAVELSSQIVQGGYHGKVEVIFDSDQHATTGLKRNRLLSRATGEYVVFVDSDDAVPEYYISEVINAIESGADCFAINGIHTTNGRNKTQWFISKDNPYSDSHDQHGKRIYLRYPNHITPMKRSIACQVAFPDKTIGEDYDWATEIRNRGLIKTEFKIEKPMYHYRYVR